MAVKVTRLPPPELAGKEELPQGSRAKLHPESILPTDQDEKQFIERAQLAVMQTLSTYFASFEHLKGHIRDKRMDYQAIKADIRPLALMDTDESIIDNNIDILLQSAKDMAWTGEIQQCVIGARSSYLCYH